MNEQYTYIEIRKTAPATFFIYDNTAATPINASEYSGVLNDDSTLTINTKTGHPLYNHQIWSIYRYVDANNSANNFTPISPIDLQTKLIQRGFYMESNVVIPPDIIDQDNIDIYKSLVNLQDSGFTDLQRINSLPTYNVNEKQSVWFKVFKRRNSLNNTPIEYNLYEMANKGKGTYGLNGTQLIQTGLGAINSQNDLEYHGTFNATPLDIETMDNVVINDLGSLPNGDYLTAANQSEWDFSDAEKEYFFTYTTDDVLYFVQFVGQNGVYNGNFVATDFVSTTNSNIQPDTSVQSVGGYKVYNNDPQNPQIIYPIGDNRNFQVYGSVQGFNGLGQSLRYLTDTWRKIDLRPLVPGLTSAITEILKNGNDLFMVANTTANTNESRPIKLMNMPEGGIVNNELIFEPIQSRDLALKVRTHGSDLHRGYVYLSTRPEVGSSIPTQIVKVNPKNLNDVTILEIPDARSTDIIGYKDNVYIYAANAAQNKMRFIKIDQDLKGYSIVFEWDRQPGVPYKAPQSVPFIIYNDEIYTLHAVVDSTTTKKNLTVDVYNFKGELVRTNNIQINPTNQSRRSYYIPHWMTVINGKLIVTPSDTTVATPPVVNSWEILRIDCESLLLEEAYMLPNACTDDNFTDDANYIYTNGEGTNYDNTYLGKLYYLDFANTYQNLVSPWTSTGTINGKIFVDKEAQIINVSQLNYDFKYQPGIIYLIAKGWQNGVKNTGIGIELNDVIFYFGSDGRYGNWQYSNLTGDNNVQNINNYTFFGIDINA